MSMLDVEGIAKALGKARKVGDGWSCVCPAHDDHRASLSLTVRDGQLLWCCHAGCDQVVVRNGMRQAGVLMDGDARPAERKVRKQVVAVYPYTDERGQVLYEKVRFNPKGFVQRLPSGTYKLGDTRRVLYHLPEVIAAEAVVIVEGEKDADRLRALGFVATTNVEGASKSSQKPKWRGGYSAALARQAPRLPTRQ
jgi:putative DNA primase/helicase